MKALELRVEISIPYLWGDMKFRKNEWGAVNYLVGPNATGKTLFAEHLRQRCEAQGLKVRYLSTERLSGLQRRRYDLFGISQIERGLNIGQFSHYKSYGKQFGLSADAFITLREKLDVRIRIEAALSQFFGRRIRLAEEGGFLKPKIQKTDGGGDEYSLSENECHGLKELITLLTFLYDDETNCLIIDEPELHLHPQFQTFFLQEIRAIAGDPNTTEDKKCFFLVTHSPYYVDIRTLEDLTHCVVFQPDKLPTYIERLEDQDEYKIKRLLPRLNTYHKQFFFATRPIFVEGYHDQQIFTQIQERRGKFLGASGSCIIDVGGKDEMDLFFRLCNNLNINAQFICDLDVVTRGSLRQSVSKDERCRNFLQTEGLETELMKTVGAMEQKIDICLGELHTKLDSLRPSDAILQNLKDAVSEANELEKKRCSFLIGSKLIEDKIKMLIPDQEELLKYIEGRLNKILQSFESCGVYILQKGVLENYLPEYKGNPFHISDEGKVKTFEKERDVIFRDDVTETEIVSRYGELIPVLDEATGAREIKLESYLSYVIGDWIHNVQSAYVRGEVKDADSLKKNAPVDWVTHSRIFDLLEFSSDLKGFVCKVKLKPIVDPREREITFNGDTVAASFRLAA